MSTSEKIDGLPTAEGIVSRRSPHSIQKTLELFKQSIPGHSLTLFAHIDHSAEARRAGLEMRETHVLIFGSPKAGTPLMITSPLIALDLPLKLLIWQDEHDQVWVSSTNPTYLSARYAIPQNLIKNIAGADALIEQTIQH
ncbi:DUF302 domain-containing protein [Dictyobacter arantiisoli]|uniref:DUF302 domain-containing protein n=1 Tax=Dictyobacter arantiisoli TaxID=2014874 RepID=A0A5A5TKN9_9CHLR|nr:DUF302 domain-containing protein [Dictyobacter arantiisoli]GCF11798.1 hypothetical protein KDI_53620 [Dictyobacter arantiisoli]